MLDTLNMHLVATMDEVLKLALEGPLTPLPPSVDADVAAGEGPDAVTH